MWTDFITLLTSLTCIIIFVTIVQVLALRGLDGSIVDEIEATSPKLEISRGKIQKAVDGLVGTPHGFSARAVGMYVGFNQTSTWIEVCELTVS